MKIVVVAMSCALVVVGCQRADSSQPAAGEQAPQAAASSSPAVIDQTVTTLGGESLDLASFRGHPMLIVNTASKCGYTPQYAGLQKLYERYKDRGLVVIGFPSNDFGGQEPGSAAQIGEFCRINYGVTFPMMAKVHAKGPDMAPIYRTLTERTPDGIRGKIRWNFTKFLVDADGRVVARFESAVKPEDPQVIAAIEKLLPQG
jgi:glutathione peroxidase